MEKLTLKIEGKGGLIDASSFLTVLRHTLVALRELDRELSDGGESVDWVVGDLKRVNPSFTDFEGIGREGATNPSIVSAFISGVETISTGGVAPRHFTERCLANIRTVASTTCKKIDRIGIKNSSGSFFYIGPSLIEHIDLALGPEFVHERTELEGSLERINVHGSKSEFGIYTPVQKSRATVCYFDPDEAEELGSLIKSRIRVFGEAKYARNGTPVSMTVESWEPIPSDDQLPTLAEMQAMDFRIAGDVDPQELIRRLRGG